MKERGRLVELATRHTNASQEDIEVLLEVEQRLPTIAMAEDTDVFIDCLSKNEREAVVLAGAYGRRSVYGQDVVGFSIRQEDEPAVFRTLMLGMQTKRVRAVCDTGSEELQLIQTAYPIRNQNRCIAALVREARYDGIPSGTRASLRVDAYPCLAHMIPICDCLEDAAIVLDGAQRVIHCNNPARALFAEFGYVDDILSSPYGAVSLHGAVRAGVDAPCVQHDASLCGRHYAVRERYVAEQGGYYLLVIRDVSVRVQWEELLLQKSMALREADHRIVNNLQTVQGLLALQERRMGDGEAKLALQDAMGRISSISTAHKLMMKSEAQVSEFSVQGLMEDIKTSFLHIDQLGKRGIRVELRGDDFPVAGDFCSSLALILNELLQNSAKHAFGSGDGGCISITAKDDALYPKIVYQDDGKGFDMDAASASRTGLGINIIRNIVKNKLKGRLEIFSDANGSVFTFDYRKRIL